MARIYSNKLVMLMFCYLMPAVLFAGHQWVGVSSQQPSQSKIIFSDTSNSSTIRVEIPGFFLQDELFEGEKYTSTQLHDGHPILSEGNPDLQKLSFSIQLLSNDNFEISVLSQKFIEYTDIDILPSTGNIARDGTTKPILKGATYKADTWFPGNLFDAEQPYIIRNTRAQAFQVYPLQYNPVTRVLRFYYEISLSVTKSEDAGINPMQERDFMVQPVAGLETKYVNTVRDSYKSGQLPSCRGRMLIICPENFREAITPLADWRKQTGIETEIVNAGQFASAEELYNFVKEYYYTTGNLAYLLLVGDANQVPTTKLSIGASDNTYAYLAGNDHYPDILVGRFSAETVKDVEVQVSRTLNYEKAPGNDAAWITTATGIASTLSPGDDGESDYQHVRKLLKTLKSTTYNQYDELFDGSEGESDMDGNPSAADVSAKINQGTGVVFYAGHGSPSTMATGSVSKSVIENLNNHGKYPMIWAAACETGNFADKYCIAEAWLRASNSNGEPTGAIAVLMASGAQTSYPPMEAQDKISELLANPMEELSTMGAVSVKGMMSMNDVYGSAGYATTDTWILFGDPSLRVRTAAPQQLIANNKRSIGSGRTSYSFKCNSPEGFACISQQGNILGTANISEGMVTIYLEQPAAGDSMTLTVTALNYLPLVETIEVISHPGLPELSVPVNHSKLQPINTSFSWDCNEGGTPEYYLFYLGTDNPPTNLINGQKLTASQIKTNFNFTYETTYYWKVEPVNSFGKTEGKTMTFSTVFEPDEDFETDLKSRLQWSDGGMQKWANDAKQYFDGKQSIRTGQINNNEFSSLVYPCEVTHCDFVSFWSKTSSQIDDKLQFLIDGSVIEEWSGLREWSFHSYKVDAGTHQLEWRYSKGNEGSAGEDAAWLDDIHLPLHAPALVSVPESGSVCEGSVFETTALAENYFTLDWQSTGDGIFEDANLENAIYKPGTLDEQNGITLLQMNIKGFEGCPEIDKTIQLTINPLPTIFLPSDTIITTGSSVELNASLEGEMSYQWLPGGSINPSLIIDSTLSVNGTKEVSINVTNQQGCSASKNIRVHFNNPAQADEFTIFPNPSNGEFTLEPVKGSAVIDNMMLLDSKGKVVWRNTGSFDVVGSKQISIPDLSRGSYFMVTENKNSQSLNQVIIQ